MAILTVDQVTTQIINQLKLLDPAVSAEVGTPERKLIEATAELIASQQVDFTVLRSQTDLSSLSGGKLDAYLSVYNFGRQQATPSYGTVTFARATAATNDIVIPQSTQVIANIDDSVFPQLTFVTTQTVVLQNGSTSVTCPCQCTIAGSIGNIDANKIVGFGGLAPINGISTVSNKQAFTGGTDGEDDASYVTRFKNTFLRNISGTEDMYLALAVSLNGISKANVVGPISRYQEYVQVPATDDANQVTPYDSAGTVFPHKRTTAESTIPYSKHTYAVNYYLTNGTLDPASANFFSPGVDYIFNTPPWNGTTGATDGAHPNQPDVTFLIGDIGKPTGVVDTPSATGGTLAAATYYYKITALNGNGESLPATEVNSGAMSGSTNSNALTWTAVPGATSYRVYRGTATNAENVYYTSTTNSFTDTGAASTAGSPPSSSTALVWPNNIASGDVFLLEHAYISINSRNDSSYGILNCVDVFVNGENAVAVDSVEIVPTSGNNLQNTNALLWTYQNSPGTVNFKRLIDGRASVVGNRIQPLYWQPVIDVPDTIEVGVNTYYKANYYNAADSTYYNQFDGISTYSFKAHYIVCKEVNSYYGTIRSRSGIEWFLSGNNYLAGALVTDSGGTYSGVTIDTQTGIQFSLNGYLYDKNIGDLQAIMEKNKQTTSDVLVHKAKLRYFQPIVTIMYTLGATQSVVNASIIANLQNYFETQYYGTAIQLSDILSVIHDTPGVDNVRWTNQGTGAVQELNADGSQLTSPTYYTTDFYIQDNELAQSPNANQVTITVRAQNTWGS